jgi:hypothetical protein
MGGHFPGRFGSVVTACTTAGSNLCMRESGRQPGVRCMTGAAGCAGKWMRCRFSQCVCADIGTAVTALAVVSRHALSRLVPEKIG